MSAPLSPVFSFTSWTKATPVRLMMLLVTEVAMISRLSRWRPISVADSSRPLAGGAAGPVDDAVGHRGGDDLPAQPVAPDLVGVLLAQAGGEVELQVLLHERIVRQVGGQQLEIGRA